MRNILRSLLPGLALLAASPFAANAATPAFPIHTTAADDAASARLDSMRNVATDLLDNRTEEGTEPGCYSADDRATFRAAIAAATTADEVSAAIKAYQAAVQTVRLSDDENEYWYYIVSGPSMTYCQDAVIYDMSTKTGEQLKWNDRAAYERAMWKFVKSPSGVRIVNKATGFYIKNPGSNGSKVTSVNGSGSATQFSLNSLGEQRGFLIRKGSEMPVHADKNGTVVAWRTVTLGSASVWHFDSVTDQDIADAAGSNDNYDLVWSDEFNTDGPVNTDYWTFEQGFVRNQEPQWYSENNAVCKDGNLVITARKEQVENPNYDASSTSWQKNRQYAEYTSSSIITKDKRDLLYGRMEVRAKIPTSSGAWPAIWCKGYPETNGSWPACGEVDILEFYQKSIFANVAWSNATGASQWRTVKTAFTHFTGQDADWTDKYHTWRMDWDSTSIRLYLDDELLNATALTRTVQPVGDYCKVENPFKTKMFILLNLALRTADTIDESVFPLNYYVDYVRFYQRKTVVDGISTVDAAAARNWLIQADGATLVDLRAFTSAPTIKVYDVSGRLLATHTPSLGADTYALPAVADGLCLVSATDGTHTYSAKAVLK